MFNSTFREKLTSTEQIIHLVAIALVAMSIALVMAPAAYHRQTGPEEVTKGFTNLASYRQLGPLNSMLVIPRAKTKTRRPAIDGK